MSISSFVFSIHPAGAPRDAAADARPPRRLWQRDRASVRRAAAATVLLGCALLGGCESGQSASASQSDQGQLLLRQFGCGSCHRIPGVATAEGVVGPPLAGVGRRAYLAGVVPNSLENMAQWIRAPHAYKPNTTMPDLGVTHAQAHAMAAYLQELR